jgi:molecular chaperone GrpE
MRIPIRYDAASDLGASESPSSVPMGAAEEKEIKNSKLRLVSPATDEPAPEPGRDLAGELERALRVASRLEADFNNYRRHAEAQLQQARERATAEVLAELGDAILGLERAIACGEGDPEAVREGVALVARGIQQIFDRHGLRRIPAVGEQFDPRLHEAVLVEEREGVERGTILRELSPGFETDDRVVRPARVAVAG